MIRAYFSSIKRELIEKINSTNEEIIIAVAWFTQRDLFSAIIASLERGVRVSLILISDIINRSEYGLDFRLFIEKGGELCFANSKKVVMHNKFCLFDRRILVTGSYNWTYSAEERNAENVIMTDDVQVCNAYNAYFSNLWDNSDEIIDYTHMNIGEVEATDFLIEYDDIFEEFQNMSMENIIAPDALILIRELKNNIGVTKLATLTTRKNRQNPTLKFSIGMRCRINGINNRTLEIIRKNQVLPFTNTVDTTTAIDNQESIVCEILLGDSTNADENKSLLKIPLEGIPKLKAGEAKFKTKVTIDTNGYMHVEYICTNIDLAKDTIYMFPEMINY